MPFATSSFLLLVVRPRAPPSCVLAPSSFLTEALKLLRAALPPLAKGKAEEAVVELSACTRVILLKDLPF